LSTAHTPRTSTRAASRSVSGRARCAGLSRLLTSCPAPSCGGRRWTKSTQVCGWVCMGEGLGDYRVQGFCVCAGAHGTRPERSGHIQHLLHRRMRACAAGAAYARACTGVSESPLTLATPSQPKPRPLTGHPATLVVFVCAWVCAALRAGTCDGLTYSQIAVSMPEDYSARKKDKLRYRCAACRCRYCRAGGGGRVS
jgi:hypothetical protein